MPLWTEEENKQYLKLLHMYGKDFYQILLSMDKSYSQVRSHFYNIQNKSEKLKKTEQPSKAKDIQFIVYDSVD
ncbi:SANT/Myb_domain [Hexamita inflata]|uniref:SANT/Myb domain n=1 Tax=Hexamita inflata TaxID=28002 RepID=A0AA86TU95_9EUKA|nr:SANT/Myb domain [Hexamita inflata]